MLDSTLSPAQMQTRNPALAFGLVLVLLSNTFAWLVQAASIDRDVVYTPWALLLLTASLNWAFRGARLTWADLGITRAWKKSAALGVVVGLVMCVGLAMFFLFPIILTGPVRYRSIEQLSGPGLAWRLGIELPIAVAFTEEVLFRGILQALFRRYVAVSRAIASTSIVFSLWHIVVNFQSMLQNPLALPFIAPEIGFTLGYIGALAAVGIGGVILSLLRERTGHLAASIIVHWLADAVMTVVVYFR